MVSPVVAFYLLLDWDRMIAKVNAMLPREHALTIRGLARDIDTVLAGFVRGQLTVCLILGTFYARRADGDRAAVRLPGRHARRAAVVHPLRRLGDRPACSRSGSRRSSSGSEPVWIFATAGIFLFGQFVEGNVLAPNLIGKSVGLHPVWLILALSVFGALFGFAGLLVAVPVAAALGVLGRFLIEQYLASPLYTGRAPPPPEGVSGLAAARQLVLDLPVRPALGRADFFVAPANALAVAQVDRWPDWPMRRLAVTGPPGAGKTHLAHVWAARAGAAILPAEALPGLGGRRARSAARRWRSRTPTGSAALGAAAEEALFHLCNRLAAAAAA